MRFFLSLVFMALFNSSSSLATPGSGIGGYMNGPCFTRAGVLTGVICEQKTVGSSTNSYNGIIIADGKYVNSSGSMVQISIHFVLNDPHGYYRKFNRLPISGWASVCGYKQGDCYWKEMKFNLELERSPYDENQYVGFHSFITEFNAGAEYSELTQWITFTPYGSSEKLVFDLK